MLVLAAPGVAAQAGRSIQLVEARQLEGCGDAAAAARLYLSWARDHAGKPSALAGYAGFLRNERGLDALIDGCRELAGSLPRMPGAWPLLAETAQLFELAGLEEEAAEIAEDAWQRGGPASLLARAMRLQLAMGDLEAYAASADRTVTVPGLDPLAATGDRLAGRLEEARLGSSRILSTVQDPAARLAAAWNLFEAARASGRGVDLPQTAGRLAELFPGSPEAAIALAAVSGKSSRVVDAPSPSMFLEAASAAPAESPAASVAKTYSVQAGAFQVRENADELVKDLSRAGFAATIREASSQSRKIYRVFVALGLDRGSAARLLERLRAAGYAGTTIAD